MVAQTFEYEIIVQCMAIVSVTSSAIVILNLFGLYLTHGRSDGQDFTVSLLYQVLAYISMGDMMGNASYLSEERPSNGTTACDVEGFFNIFAYPVSWLWTLYLTFVLYYLAVYEVMLDKMKLAYFICWGVPLAFAFGQIGNGGFARHENEPYDMCASGEGYQATLYHRITYYGLLLFCFVCMIAMRCVTLYLKFYLKDPCTLTESFRVASRTLGFYPWLLIICWTPHAVIRSLPNIPPAWHLFGICLKISHGFLLACTYFYQSAPARRFLYMSVTTCFWIRMIISGHDDSSLQISADLLDGILAGGSNDASRNSLKDAVIVESIIVEHAKISPLHSHSTRQEDESDDQEMVNVV